VGPEQKTGRLMGTAGPPWVGEVRPDRAGTWRGAPSQPKKRIRERAGHSNRLGARFLFRRGRGLSVLDCIRCGQPKNGVPCAFFSPWPSIKAAHREPQYFFYDDLRRMRPCHR
jgi:hypothetical protein